MKKVFVLLAIDLGSGTYLKSAKNLITEILGQTKHDVILSTNNVEFFSDVRNERLIVRNNITEGITFRYNSEFNYNLKHYVFENIPEKYDLIVYLDCDIKLDGWTDASDSYLDNIMSEKEYGATRLNCELGWSIDEYEKTGTTLFKHKIDSYKIRERYDRNDDIMLSRLPSEHFIILKNIKDKVEKFQQKWLEQDTYLQSINGEGGSWGDGFEIGISARYAGLNKYVEIDQGVWDGILGFKFNGNKL